MTTPAAPTLGMTITARAAPNCTDTPAETTSATGPNREARAGAETGPEAGPETGPEAGPAVVGDEEDGAGMNPD
ncbi:hypothetical protein Slala02_50030 [Streptomyces lavendulae subsp. lavendulae]|nr:hypothetical protein Slala01_25390 [Streptomyces lavendulae subsp. lavendulae]GLX29183.1 hypothetical protein Slala02_50030 [Streptomyces lavendulae subsp. lavendulae]